MYVDQLPHGQMSSCTTASSDRDSETLEMSLWWSIQQNPCYPGNIVHVNSYIKGRPAIDRLAVRISTRIPERTEELRGVDGVTKVLAFNPAVKAEAVLDASSLLLLRQGCVNAGICLNFICSVP